MISGRFYALCDSLPDTEKLRQEPGVYCIFAIGRDGKPLKLGRVAKRDRKGILYIGNGTKLRTRVQALRGIICKGHSRGHIAGTRYHKSSKINKMCPPHRLRFRFEHCENCEKRETEELVSYFRVFGEVPPLNASLRPRYIT